MQLASAQLSEHLQRGLKSLYTLHGDEPLLVQECAGALRASARAQGYTERTVHTASGAHFDWSKVLAIGGSLSVFADKQIVEIRIPSGKPGKNGSVALPKIDDAALANLLQAAHKVDGIVKGLKQPEWPACCARTARCHRPPALVPQGPGANQRSRA